MTENTLPRLTLHRAEVTAVRHLAPRFVRVTFGGPGLDDFTCAGVAPKIKIYIPAAGAEARDDGSTAALTDGADVRTYTVRSYRPGQGEIDIDFVVHGDGPAGRWASEAVPGRRLVVSSAAGYPPVSVDRILFVGDPSSLPAVMTVLESLPETTEARVLLRVDGPDEVFDMEPAADGVTRWVYTGADGEALAREVRQVVEHFDPGYVWAAGEAGTLKVLRRYLRKEAGFSRDTSHIVGYWRRHVTADVYDSETISRAEELLRSGVPLTPQEMDELSVDPAVPGLSGPGLSDSGASTPVVSRHTGRGE